MPLYREVYIENSKTLADSGTETIDLALVDPLSMLDIRVNAKNGATSNKNSPISRCITNIEVVDGSDKIYSLDGMLSQAISYYMSGRVPAQYRQAGPSENQSDNFMLYFGRRLWDPLYALVPNAFRNLQLKVSWDLANVNSVGATGFLTNTAQLTVIARIMEELPTPPVGYMMSKDHYSWTTPASGDERVDLPTDHPYVLFALRAWETETKLQSTITNLKLSLDQDKKIPFDLETWDLLMLMQNMYGPLSLDQHIFAGTEENVQTWLGFLETATVTPETDSQAPTDLNALVNVHGVDSGHVNLVSRNPADTAAVEAIHHLRVSGQALNHTLAYPFGEIADPASWLMAPTYGSIKAIVTQGNAGAAANMGLVQARRY